MSNDNKEDTSSFEPYTTPQSYPEGCSDKERVDAADTRSFWTMVLLAIQNAFNDKYIVLIY